MHLQRSVTDIINALRMCLDRFVLWLSILYCFCTCKSFRFPQLSYFSKMPVYEDSQDRIAHVEGKKIALPQVHPPPIFLLLPPALSLCSASFCSLSLPPSPLFVPGMYQPERGKRRREGGGVSQHVRQGRGGKRERIACGGGTEKADGEVGRGPRLKVNSFNKKKNNWVFPPPIISCC